MEMKRKRMEMKGTDAFLHISIESMFLKLVMPSVFCWKEFNFQCLFVFSESQEYMSLWNICFLC